MNFPPDFPVGCPVGSTQYRGDYFRFASAHPTPRHEKNHKAPISRFRGPGDPTCGHWALSGYLSNYDLEEARKSLQTRFPKAATWPIMIYDLHCEDGEIKLTPTEDSVRHHDLWLYEDSQIERRLK